MGVYKAREPVKNNPGRCSGQRPGPLRLGPWQGTVMGVTGTRRKAPALLWSVGWSLPRPVNLPAEVEGGKHQPECHIRDAGRFLDAAALPAE